ncbi:hypothetical protein [Nocardia alni]|uniref:hypothetical protein n=1 Tax=Nocardia alni TaxID=2815723 RepID=UPI001C2338E4|nr:hypothetical protein [Nocardia alni]
MTKATFSKLMLPTLKNGILNIKYDITATWPPSTSQAWDLHSSGIVQVPGVTAMCATTVGSPCGEGSVNMSTMLAGAAGNTPGSRVRLRSHTVILSGRTLLMVSTNFGLDSGMC